MYEQRTIEAFFQEFGVKDADLKARLLPLLTHVIYGYNKNVIEFEKEQDEYRKKQFERGLEEIVAKIKQIIQSEQSGQGGTYEP
jgi:hypothetical protein